MNLLVVNPFRRFGRLYFCESPSNCVFLWKSFTMTTFRIFAAWFAYKSLQVSADASFQHLEISLAGPHVTTIWWNKYNMEFSAFIKVRIFTSSSTPLSTSSSSSTCVCPTIPPVAKFCVSLRQGRSRTFPHTLLEFQLFLTLCWSLSFSSHFDRVRAFPDTLVEFEFFLTLCSSSSFSSHFGRVRAFGLSLPLTDRPWWLLVYQQ